MVGKQEKKIDEEKKEVQIKSIFLTSKQAFVVALIAILLSPISLLIAYYLNNKFEAPKLSIEYIIPEPELDLKISDRNHKIVKLYMTQFKSFLIQIASFTPEIEECFEKNKFNKHTLKKSLDLSQRVDEMLKDWIRILEGNKGIIKDWEKGNNLIMEPLIIVNESLHALVYKNKDLALDTIRSEIKLNNSVLSKLEPLIEELAKLNDIKETMRNGKIKFRIGILNSGKTDGVIFPDAKIRFGDSTLTLNKEEIPPGSYVPNDYTDTKYPVIYSHTFKELIYVVKEDENAKKDYEKLVSLVKHFNQDSFQIELSTGNDYIVGTARFPSQP